MCENVIVFVLERMPVCDTVLAGPRIDSVGGTVIFVSLSMT